MAPKISSSTEPQSSDLSLNLPIADHIYDQLIAFVFEVKYLTAASLGCCLVTPITYSAYGALPLSSRYKILGQDLHRSLSKIKPIDKPPDLQFAGGSCDAHRHQSTRVFTQFNESFDYPPVLIASNMGLSYSGQDIADFEIKLLRVLGFKLNQLTPYCFINILKKYVPEK